MGKKEITISLFYLLLFVAVPFIPIATYKEINTCTFQCVKKNKKHHKKCLKQKKPTSHAVFSEV